MTNLFETILEQLRGKLQVELQPDRHGVCAFTLNRKFTVQLQLDSTQEKLLIAAFIYLLPPGPFCENVLTEALKANNLPDPRAGIFSYLKATSQLVLHQIYPVRQLNEETLAVYVANLIDYALIWHEALERGQPTPAPIASVPSDFRPFGLKP